MRRIVQGIVVALALAGGTASVAAAPKERNDTAARATWRGVVNLNQADEATLELLPGIGPTKAKRIVEFRKAKPFKKIDDLGKVKGFGRKTLARLKPHLAVSGATTLVEEVPKAK